jgi:hypothetical protein
MGVGAFLRRLPGLGLGLEKGRPSEQTKKIERSMGMVMSMGINEDRPTVLLLHPDLDGTPILD